MRAIKKGQTRALSQKLIAIDAKSAAHQGPLKKYGLEIKDTDLVDARTIR